MCHPKHLPCRKYLTLTQFKVIGESEIVPAVFPDESLFQFENDSYSVKFTPAEEIRMGLYIRMIGILKNNSLFFSGRTADPDYLELTSPDRRYLFIPFESDYCLYDLGLGTFLRQDMLTQYGNHFDNMNKYLLTVGPEEFQLVDLEKAQVTLQRRERDLLFSQAHFGSDNLIWTIKKGASGQSLIKIDPPSLKETCVAIPSPFEVFSVDGEKYKKLMDSNGHCLWDIKNGGMAFSGLLNSWRFVKTVKSSVYKTAVPVSDISYSKSYKVDFCEFEYRYISIDV